MIGEPNVVARGIRRPRTQITPQHGNKLIMHKRRSRFARKTLLTLTAAATFALSIAPGIQAAGRHGDGHGHADSGPGHATAIGQRGHRAEASRLIEIVMTENQFTPNRISIRRGETVRFVLRNTDDSFHEFNIGTAVTHVAASRRNTPGALVPQAKAEIPQAMLSAKNSSVRASTAALGPADSPETKSIAYWPMPRA